MRKAELRITLRRVSVLPFLTLALVACQATARATARTGAPPTLPEGYVVTPHGLIHRSCVRAVAAGETVDAQGAVIAANGERTELPPCRHPRLDKRTLQPIEAGQNVSPTINGWIAYADWTASTPLGYFTATFQVPASPTIYGATVFFFPGSEPTDGSTILQPVLQWGESGAGGGNYWAAASWFCCPSGWLTHSALIDVNAGDTIASSMVSDCSGSTCSWYVKTADMTTDTFTSLAAQNVTTPFLWNFGGVLESYRVSECAQNPASGSITFSNLVLRDENGNAMSPTWTNDVPASDPDCGYAVSSSPNSVTVTWTP